MPTETLETFALPTDDGAPSARLKILIVEDHSLLAESLRSCLDAEGLQAELAPLTSGEAVIAAAERLQPDVVLLDLDLGGSIGEGLSLIPGLAGTGARVVVVSGTSSRERMGACIEAGADGVVSKSRSLAELVAFAKDAAARRPLLSREERRELLAELERQRDETARFGSLTPREQAVLAALVAGKSAGVIAEDSHVSEGTVRTQIRSVLTKLEVNSQLAAVAAARKAGWPWS